MKLNNIKKQAGLTLIEVTLVIAVLLGLISVLFIGVSAYREGSNRANCILNISNVQKAVRSYQNLYDKRPTNPLAKDKIIGAGLMIENEPTCPSQGEYTFGTTVPAIGTAYLTCSLAGTGDGKKEHNPSSTSGW